MTILDRGRGRRRGVVLITAGSLMAFQALAVIGAAPALADTCSFSAATSTATVDQDPGDDSTLSVGTGGAIELDGTACGSATTSNTTTVSVLGDTGSEEFTIDNSDTGGAFPASVSFAWDGGAGAADEFGYVGTSGADNVTVGTSGVNIDADGAVDVTLTGVEAWDFDLGAGNDVFSAAGAGSTGSPLASDLETAAGGDGVDGDAGDDTLTGGNGADEIDGGADADTISGGLGDDASLFGGTGNDRIAGDAGADVADGDAGDDVLVEGTAANGADDLFGGSGGETDGDTVDYSGRTNAVTVGIGGPASDGESGEGDDVDADVENIIGGAGGDSLSGDGDANILTGGSGNDALDGGGGSDTANYSSASAAVTVDLAAGTSTGGAGSDTLTSIENATGSGFNDTLTGSSAANTLKGGDGNDVIAGAAGSDTEMGGSGNDSFDQGSATNGGDDIDGEAGTDWVDYSARTASVTATLSTAGTDDGAAGEGDDVDGVENAALGTSDDMFIGDSFNNIVMSGGGQNVLDGGAGADTLDYSVGYTAGVQVDLGGGAASVDSISAFENVIGTQFADTINGSAGNNVIKSGAGKDRVRASSGDDTVRAGAGNDNVRGGGGDDDLFGGSGNDFLSGGGGVDFCRGGPGNDTLRGCETGRA